MNFLGNLLILYLRVIDYTYDTLILRHAQGVYTGGRYTNTHGIASSLQGTCSRYALALFLSVPRPGRVPIDDQPEWVELSIAH